MRYSVLIIISFILLGVEACRKGGNAGQIDNKVTLEAGDYSTSDIVYVDSPIMYIHDNLASITNQQIIKDFLNRHNALDTFTFSNLEVNNNPITFNFSSAFSFTDTSFSYVNAPVNVTITSNSEMHKGIINGIRVRKAISGLESFNIDANTGLRDSSTAIEIKETDTDSIPFFFQSSADYCWQGIEYYRGLPSYVISCPIKSGYTKPDTSDILKCYYVPQFPLLYINGKFKLPLFSFVFYSKDNNCLYMKKNEWNYFFAHRIPFEPSAWLKAGDTLVIQNKTAFLN